MNAQGTPESRGPLDAPCPAFGGLMVYDPKSYWTAALRRFAPAALPVHAAESLAESAAWLEQHPASVVGLACDRHAAADVARWTLRMRRAFPYCRIVALLTTPSDAASASIWLALLRFSGVEFVGTTFFDAPRIWRFILRHQQWLDQRVARIVTADVRGPGRTSR